MQNELENSEDLLVVPKCKGYKYYFDEEKIREYMKVPVLEKFRWLDEAQQFCEMFMTEKAKEIREKLRKGEI